MACVAAPAAHAVIQFSSEQRLTDPTPDSAGYTAWQLQGFFGSFTATAIGPHHILTAKHIGQPPSGLSTPFYFRGQQYNSDPTFNGVGYALDPNSDLMIVRIQETLPAWATLNTSNDEGVRHLVTVGRGTPRDQPVVVNGATKGWTWGVADGAMSWGENDLVTGTPNFGAGLGEMLQFDFGPTAGDTALSAGDSGGGVFVQHNGQWKLAGVNYAAESEFKLAPTDTTTFFASVHDRSGLYYKNGQPASEGPSTSFATRISSNLGFLYNYVEAPPVVLASYDVTNRDDVGDVDVSGAVTIGPLARLKAYHVRSSSLSLGNNAVVTIKPNGNDRGVSKVSQLTLGNAARLDLNDNDLIVQATEQTRAAVLTQVANWVKSARNNAWQGPGIGSTAAHDDPDGRMILGIAPNRNRAGTAIHNVWGGLDVDENSILVKYTIAGDLNLDGLINIGDYLRIDRGVAMGAAGYWNGDANYDGRIDGADYFLMDSHYLGQFAAPAGGIAAGAVPEPGAMAILALGAIGLLRRRR